MPKQFNRAVEDLGNVVALEHLNTTVPDQQLATLFYVTGLGLTRDPYIQTGLVNMWINVGRSQIHLPTGKPQVVRGHAGMILPDREALLARLSGVQKQLAETRFSFAEREAYVEAVSPWGNVIRCYAPDEQRFGRVVLGMPYVEFTVPPGSAEGIARFYQQILKTSATVQDEPAGRCARVVVGVGQELVYRETDKPLPDYDGHHVQIYVADFSGPHRWLKQKELIKEESDQHQYRFEKIVDPDSGKHLFTMEHEVRSLRHPLYGRPLLNRNPDQTNRDYFPGFDSMQWGMNSKEARVNN